jgi:carboxypeptidase D
VYITGESYAGRYCPYIASNMIAANDSTYFNVDGMLIYDPLIAKFALNGVIPAHYHINYWANVSPLNDTAWTRLRNISAKCGYDAYLDKYLTFPPASPQPNVLPPGKEVNMSLIDPVYGCDTQSFIADAMTYLNPGWNIYQVTQLLPLPGDVLGFAASTPYTAPGQQIYFNRTDVKKAIHAPPEVSWEICSEIDVFAGGSDASEPSINHVIPHVIDSTKNVIISHGMNDFVLQPNGTLLAIQNMTWGGQLGFQTVPNDPLFVPHHPNDFIPGSSGQGVLGTTHTERGLTWNLVMLSGHMVPGWQTAVAFRQLEVLLRRVGSMDSTQPLSIYPNVTQPSADSLGKGSAPVLGRSLNETQSGTGGGSCDTGNGSGNGTGTGGNGTKSESRNTLKSLTLLKGMC